MKFNTLIALGLVATINAAEEANVVPAGYIDFDGDGVDDYDYVEEEECEGRDCKDEETENDDWMEAEEYENGDYEEWEYDDFEDQKIFKILSAMNANMTSDSDG